MARGTAAAGTAGSGAGMARGGATGAAAAGEGGRRRDSRERRGLRGKKPLAYRRSELGETVVRIGVDVVFSDFRGSGGGKKPILIEPFGWVSGFSPSRIRL